MVRKLLTIFMLSLPVAAAAQTGIVASHPANNEGRMLTMEEAVLGRNTRPDNVYAMWVNNDTYVIRQGGKWMNADFASGNLTE